jgi:hypothetical protein
MEQGRCQKALRPCVRQGKRLQLPHRGGLLSSEGVPRIERRSSSAHITRTGEGAYSRVFGPSSTSFAGRRAQTPSILVVRARVRGQGRAHHASVTGNGNDEICRVIPRNPRKAEARKGLADTEGLRRLVGAHGSLFQAAT